MSGRIRPFLIEAMPKMQPNLQFMVKIVRIRDIAALE